MKTNTGAGRRAFLKTVALAGGAGSASGAQETQGQTKVQRPASAKAAPAIQFPRSFSGPQLATIAFPLGGIGTGSISLGGRGQLRDWEIFNKPDKGKRPTYAFGAIWARAGSNKPVVSVLEAVQPPPYEGGSGLGVVNAPGLPRLDSAKFTGSYPLARVDFTDEVLPVRVSLEAFTPFFPLDADDSGLPVAVLRYRVTNPGRVSARAAIVFSIDNPVGVEGRENERRKGEGIEGLLMRNPSLAADDPLAGSFALSAIEVGSGKLTSKSGWRARSGWRGPIAFWDDFSSDGELSPDDPNHDNIGSICIQRDLAPGASADYTFLLSWHFPNRTPERCGWKHPEGEGKTIIGNWYCTRFADAWKAAEYAAANLPRLEKRTRAFVDAIRETTLPGVVRDAATANLSTYVTQTCFRSADGAFHGFEGTFDRVGSCFGNCTHVWNYEVATPHLFPTLSRSLRESAFGFCTSETGAQDFRQLLPANKQHYGIVAADGQMGSILKLYLDWRLSGDDGWLRKHWPAAKRALEYAWIPGGWDADRDGVMEGVQHNTYDVEFYGPNPLSGVWYLTALRASEEMARKVGDAKSADEYRRLFNNGSKWIDQNLFNGEYYIQKIRGIKRDSVPKEQFGGLARTDTENPELQLGEGCLVDQLVGQFLAEVAGLGDMLDGAKMRKALQSIMKYNFKPNLRRHESMQRTYAVNDEAALIVCDYGGRQTARGPFSLFFRDRLERAGICGGRPHDVSGHDPGGLARGREYSPPAQWRAA